MTAEKNNPKQVLVLGGTGHIGAAIARSFAEAGWAVTAAGRRPEPRPNLAGTAVRQVAGDDTQGDDLARWAEGAQLVVDAATPYPLRLYEGSPAEVIGAARRRAARLIEWVGRKNQGALVHISSFTTLPSEGGLSDRLRLATVRGLHPYFAVKEAVERDVLAALKGGLAGCVINPTACFGPYDLKPPEQSLIPLLVQGRVPGSLRHPVDVVDVRDVAAVVRAAVAAGYPDRQVAVSGHSLPADRLVALICALAQVPPPPVRVPLLPTLAGSYWSETFAALAGRQSRWPSLPMLLTAAGGARRISAAQQRLGVMPRPLEHTLRDALAWYRTVGAC